MIEHHLPDLIHDIFFFAKAVRIGQLRSRIVDTLKMRVEVFQK